MANTLTFSGQTLTDADLYGGITYIADMNVGEEFTIGNTASASVTFLTDVQLPLYSKDNVGGTFTWTQDETAKGRFYITEVSKESGKYVVTAYDALLLLETNISALSISYPATMSALAASIATYIGCTVQGTITNSSLSVSSLDDDMTVRELLGYIAEASGCSVKIGASDHLCFMYYASSDITVTASDYINLEAADYTCTAIEKVIIFNSEGEIQAQAGSGSNALYISQNPFLEEATTTNATNIYNAVKNFVYVPLTCSMFEENGIEIGTTATFGSALTLVMHLEASEDGVVVSSVGSDSRAEYNKSVVELANEAKTVAVSARDQAIDAANAADSAEQSAAEAKADAYVAHNAADQARIDAKSAKASAVTANSMASAAQASLGDIEKVVDALNWIAEHGDYEPTQDTLMQDGKFYFSQNSDGTYAQVTPTVNPRLQNYYAYRTSQGYEPNWAVTTDTDVDADKQYYEQHSSGGSVYYTPVFPDGNENPSEREWYELLSATFVRTANTELVENKLYFNKIDEHYELSTDTQVEEGTTYYSKSGDDYTQVTPTSGANPMSEGWYELIPDKYTVITEYIPNPQLLGLYELKDVDASISNYVSSHVSLDNDGLVIQTDSVESKVRISGDGVILTNEVGETIAVFSEQITLGDLDGIHVSLSATNGLEFWNGGTKVAYVNSSTMMITKAEITNTLRIGAFEWKTQGDTRISLVYAP